MSLQRYFFILLFILLPLKLYAGAIVVDLDKRNIAIESDFKGDKIAVYGIQRLNGKIVIEFVGPTENISVLQKKRHFGMWVNENESKFDGMPFLYHILYSSGQRGDEVLEYYYKLFQKKPLFEADELYRKQALYLSEYMYENELYNITPGVEYLSDFFFKATITIPAEVREGDYRINFYLLEESRIADKISIPLNISKIGLAALLEKFAEKYSLIYGITSVLIAITLGWFASWLFNKR